MLKVHEILFKKGILVDLDVHQWRAQKKLTKEDLLLDKTIQEDLYYTGHKKLLPKKALAPLIEIEGKARLELDARSSPFPIAKARFVTFPVLNELMNVLEEYQKAFFVALDELILNYDKYKDEQLAHLDVQIQAIADEDLKKAPEDKYQARKSALGDWVLKQKILVRDLYPPKEQLKARFGFEWRLFKITNAEGVDSSNLTPAQVKAINQKLDGDMQDWVKTTTKDVHQELGEAAQHLYELLDKQGKLHSKNLKRFFEAAEKFLASEFLESKYVGMVKTMKANYLITSNDEPNWELMAQNMSFVHQQDGLKGVLAAIAELASEQMAIQAAMDTIKRSEDFGRVVDLT